MWPILGIRTKYSPNQFAKFLADALLNHFKDDYDQYKFPMIEKINKSSNQNVLFNEWVMIEMFILTIGILSYFKGSPKSFMLMNYVNTHYCEFFVESKAFNNVVDFQNLLQLRFNEYKEAYSNERDPGGVYWVSKNMIKNLNGSGRDIAEITMLSEYFTNSTLATKKFMTSLMKKIKIKW